MKKIISLLLSVSLLLFLVSCEAEQPFFNKSFLNKETYGEDFRARNEILFPNDACEHVEVSVSHADPWEAKYYHVTKCKFGNCEYVSKEEAHTFVFTDTTVRGGAIYKENGYLYHEFGMYCDDCNAWVLLSVLCQTQDTSCGTITKEDGNTYQSTAACCEGVDYQALFRDTPYTIVVKDAPYITIG